MLKNLFNKSKNKPEKRRYQRWDFVQATFYKISDSEKESKVFECFLNNISLGGISFDTQDENLSAKDSIKLMYKIGTVLRRDTLNVKHICRVFNNWRIGCEFQEEDEERNEMIVRYVKSLISNE